MNAPGPTRGRTLVRRAGPHRRALAAIFHRFLDALDDRLIEGGIDAHLPDGRFRILGQRAPGPVAQVTIVRWRALLRLAVSGSVGWYEGWAAGDWTSPDPVPLFALFMQNRRALGRSARAKGMSRLLKRLKHGLRRNDRRGARRNIMAHYDLGNDFYAAWLDETMSYSSAIFKGDESLADAQRRKQDAVLDRVSAGPGTTLLEIGCGWGSLAAAAAARGAAVTAISLSPAQLAFARAHHREIDFRNADYREVEGRYDAIVSVEMVEAVGEAYWPAFADAVARCLKPGGRAAIQYIAIADDIFERYRESVDFIQAYVFPGGMLLSETRFRALAKARGLAWTDHRTFGDDYARTLAQWRHRFDRAVDDGRLPAGFDKRFVDLWRYYLMYCEGGFCGGGITVAQVTLVREG